MLLVYLKKYRKLVACGVFFFYFGCIFTLCLLKIDCTDIAASTTVEDIHSSVEYAVVIPSKYSHESVRDSIRNTWMKLANNIVIENGTRVYKWHDFPERNKVPDFIRFYFVVGIQYMAIHSTMQLIYEFEENKDMILLEDVYEAKDFHNLPLKMLKTMEWLSKNLKNLKYVIKCDEKSFVRIDLIIRDLEAYGKYLIAPELAKYVSYKLDFNPTTIGIYWGFFTGQEQAYKFGQWAEKRWFQCDNYVPYALGAGYIISKSIVHYISNNAKRLNQYKSEDVSMGLWTSGLRGIHRVHDIRFDTKWNSWQPDTLVLHYRNMTESLRIYMYTRLIKNKGVNLSPFLSKVRKNYYYKWDGPPSKCCK